MSTVAIAAVVEASNVPPRVRLNVTSADATSTTITRLNPDGTTSPVRTNDGNPLVISGGTALLYDYEMPFGMSVTYSSLESPATTSATVTVDASSVWLVHPGVPALSMSVDLRANSLAEESYGVNQGVFWPMGRETPVIVTDGTRRGMQSSITVGVDNANDVRAIRELVRDAGVLFLNIPDSFGYLVDSCYIAVSDVSVRRPSDVGSDPHRDVTLPVYVVDRPVGGSQSERTYVDVLADFPTYASLMPAYASYTALLAGP